VYTLTSTNTVEYRPVVLGPLVNGLRVVRSGLAPGDEVVVNGLQRVRSGMAVAPRAEMVALGGTTERAAY
jgi:multidrug efflux pump subunit AcrA (membrane-fusion protein)